MKYCFLNILPYTYAVFNAKYQDSVFLLSIRTFLFPYSHQFLGPTIKSLNHRKFSIASVSEDNVDSVVAILWVSEFS